MLSRRKDRHTFDYSKSVLIVIDMLEGQVGRNSVLMNHYRSIHPEMPEWFLNQIEGTVEPNIRTLLSAFRKNNGLVVHAKMCSSVKNYSDLPIMMQLGNSIYDQPLIDSPGAPSSSFISSISPQKDEAIVHKSACSAFEGTALEKTLHRNSIETVVLVGVFTNACIASTARSAFDKGFDGVVISDACSDLTPKLHDAALMSLETMFAGVCRTDQVTNL